MKVSSPQDPLQSNDVVPTDGLLVVKEEENPNPTFKVPAKTLPVAKKREHGRSKDTKSRPPDKKLKTEASPKTKTPKISRPKPSNFIIFLKLIFFLSGKALTSASHCFLIL